jgi:predicted nucleotidyltransferase
MAKLLRDLLDRNVLSRTSMPKHFPDSVQYMTIMGSEAYGVANEGASDRDIYGFCIPEKHVIFPHLAGHIPGFGQQPEKFEQWMVHHVKDAAKNTEYDFTIYNIVKYFSLVMENNPNMVDSLFTPQNAILHCSPIAQIVRDERHIFLHKGAWHKFKGYAYSQMHKIRSKETSDALKAVTDFENTYGLSHETLLEDVQLELQRRGLFASQNE